MVAPRPHTLWIVACTSALAAALIGMFAWMSWNSYRIVIADTYVSSSNLALSVEQFVARTIETIDLSLQVVGDESESGRARGTGPLQARLADRLQRSPQITGLAVIGADGRLRAGTAAFPATASTVSEQAYFRRARAGDGIEIVLGDPLGERADGKEIILSRRFKRADGSVAGVIAATLNRDYVQQFFYTLKIGEEGIIVLETSDATVLARRPYLEDYIGRNFAASAIFTEWLPVASSGVFPMRYQIDGLWRIVGYQRIEKLPLVVHVALSRGEALAHWRGTTLMQGGVGAGLLLAFCLLAALLHRELQGRMLAHGQLRATVDELERARLVAEESNRVKSQFVAHMSHELRTPLNAIIGFSEMIRDALIGPLGTRYRAYARDIHSSGAHLLRLINDVLDLSKVEAGRVDLHEEMVDLVKLAEDCRRLVADSVKAGKLELSIELAPHLPLIRGDELRLKQILLNLLSNAVKFTAAGGRIALTAATTVEGGVAVSVADTGIGMAPEDIPIALEPFRQLDGAFNRRFEGTGLGLPLARRMAELHGATLSLSSVKDRGTIATLTLPADRIIERPAIPFKRREAAAS
jgi:two-component system, cell cycle sensor histidine kinase PleC